VDPSHWTDCLVGDNLFQDWPQGHVRTTFVIVRRPLVQQTSQVVFGQRDHKIQAFPPQRADEPLAEGIRLGALGWCLEHPETQVAQVLVEVP
jgi:hypothetical protein